MENFKIGFLILQFFIKTQLHQLVKRINQMNIKSVKNILQKVIIKIFCILQNRFKLIIMKHYLIQSYNPLNLRDLKHFLLTIGIKMPFFQN